MTLHESFAKSCQVDSEEGKVGQQKLVRNRHGCRGAAFNLTTFPPRIERHSYNLPFWTSHENLIAYHYGNVVEILK
jgi:hypothetical protein